MPIVDGGVELHPRISRVPSRFGDAVPQAARAHLLGDLAGGPLGQRPLMVGFDGAQEGVGDAHRVVGILTGDGRIGFRFPVEVERREFDVAIALARELDNALDVVLGQLDPTGGDDFAPERRIASRIERRVALDVAVEAGAHDGAEMAVGQARPGVQGRDLLLLAHLPRDEVLDVGMVDVDRHHLGRASRRAARLDGARRAVADLEERHQTGGTATAGELLAGAAKAGEIRAGARAILEKPRFADPQVHDAAVAHQIVGDALDEAGMRLRTRVCRVRRMRDAVAMIDEPMALARTVNAVSPVQPGVEPLRRVGRADLCRQHPAMLVVEGASVVLAVEIPALPTPIGPGARHAMEHFARTLLATISLVGGQGGEGSVVGHRAPQPLRHVVVGNAHEPACNSSAPKVLLRQHVGGDRRPGRRNFDAKLLEDDGAVGGANFGVGSAKRHSREWRLSCSSIPTLQTHRRSPVLNSRQ